jgi:hypothetical protein
MGATSSTSAADLAFCLDFDAAVLALGIDFERQQMEAQGRKGGIMRRRFGVS